MRSLENPGLNATEELALAIRRATGATRVLLYGGEEGNRWIVARIESDPLTRRAQFLDPGAHGSGAIAPGQQPEWISLAMEGDAWRAALEVRRPNSLVRGLVIEGVGPGPELNELRRNLESSRVTALAALAAAIEKFKVRGAPRSWNGDGSPSAMIPESAHLHGSLFELPLEGNPPILAASSVFAAFPEIVGRSTIMAGILQGVLSAARSDIPVLIEGESGTGKELVARAIHNVSKRREHPFVCENCGALPENLVESEFFGHEKGAFTGADQARPGVFVRALGGTVFLDEVGEMDLALQRKLLRVLEEREVRPLGGQKTIPVDFRLVSATNRVLEEMVAKGEFREDLYYRLQVTTIHMPALRERPEDVHALIQHFAEVFAGETDREPVRFTAAALNVLVSYSWPGNVRELRNEVWRHACSERSLIDVEHLSKRISRSRRPSSGGWSLSPRSLQELERNTIAPILLEALHRTGGNRSEAARLLGISRTVLYRRLKRYKLLGDA